MMIYPAIDIKDGKCVRLIRGEAKSGKVYGDPIDFAKRWQDEGAQYLHVVDLDAAFTGEFANKDVIKKIVTSVKIPVQLGGGVRTREGVKQRLEEVGVSRVIIGTMAVEDPDFISWAKGEYGKDRIAVGIDAKGGKVLTRGWVKSTTDDAIELAVKVKEMGIKNIIYTDIMRDGMLEGPNIDLTEQMVKKTWLNIIASGGIKTCQDIINIRNSGAVGAIIGTALYEKTLTLTEAMRIGK